MKNNQMKAHQLRELRSRFDPSCQPRYYSDSEMLERAKEMGREAARESARDASEKDPSEIVKELLAQTDQNA